MQTTEIETLNDSAVMHLPVTRHRSALPAMSRALQRHEARHSFPAGGIGA